MQLIVHRLLVCAVLFTAIVSSTGCKPGKEARKTLPDTGITEEAFMFPALPFYAVDTTVGGQRFTAIYLRNEEFDSLALNMVKAWEPFAPSVMKMITDRKVKGVLIDFRSNSVALSNESVFNISAINVTGDALQSSAINLRFVWDDPSSSRASVFINELRQLTSIAINETTGDLSNSKQNCFTPARPGF